jgi:hypothetical protein
LIAIGLLLGSGCGHRQTGDSSAGTAKTNTGTTTPPLMLAVSSPTKTFRCDDGNIQFDYPADWQPDKSAQTAVFSVDAPSTSAPDHHCSLNLDIPKLPSYAKMLLSLHMVASEYEKDLKNNQIHDAVKEEDVNLTVPDASAKRITSRGHENGKTLVDIAVILIHADRVYIFSADCDDQSCDTARRTLDTAIASLKWTK